MGARPFCVAIRKPALPERWATTPRTYWARFESVFVEQFETQNPTSPTKSARLRHIAGRLKLRLESEPPDGTTESNLD
jgi:hypothetical protein